jgi:hypothetical protein
MELNSIKMRKRVSKASEEADQSFTKNLTLEQRESIKLFSDNFSNFTRKETGGTNESEEEKAVMPYQFRNQTSESE